MAFQICGTLWIFLRADAFIVLRTVQFYHKLCSVTVEIHNVVSDDILSAEL